MSGQSYKSSEGFTLVELLVALFIFALVASLSMRFLYQTIESKEIIEVRSGALQEIRVARALLKMDMLHVVARPTRGRFGAVAKQSFKAETPKNGEPFLSFVRDGASNPGNYQSKSQLQHVSYFIKDQKLVRRSLARLDPSANTPAAEQVILSDITGLTVQYFVEGFWQNRLVVSPNGTVPLPDAVSMEITREPYGKTNHTFLLAAGGIS